MWRKNICLTDLLVSCWVKSKRPQDSKDTVIILLKRIKCVKRTCTNYQRKTLLSSTERTPHGDSGWQICVYLCQRTKSLECQCRFRVNHSTNDMLFFFFVGGERHSRLKRRIHATFVDKGMRLLDIPDMFNCLLTFFDMIIAHSQIAEIRFDSTFFISLLAVGSNTVLFIP